MPKEYDDMKEEIENLKTLKTVFKEFKEFNDSLTKILVYL